MTRALSPIARFLTPALAALALLAPAGVAQDTSGAETINKAADAAKNLGSMTATVRLSGGGGFADFVPTGEGTLRLFRDPAIEEGDAWHTRLDTSYTHRKGDDTIQVTALETPADLVWIDHEKKAVQERAARDRRASARTQLQLFGLPEITATDPYVRELREGTSWKDLGTETVNGVETRVVEVRYDMTQGNERGGTSMIRTPTAKWFFGAEDYLPRRVERITNQAGLSYTIILDIEDLKTGTIDSAESLVVETPEGYSRTSRAAPNNRARVATPAAARKSDAEKVEREQVEREIEQLKKAQLPAHGFELKKPGGELVSLESLKGKVAVLYFWGTWCVPCKEWSPLVSDLAATFQDQPVEVFGLAVRERDEQAVRDAMKDYNHTLLLDPDGKPIGCDETARAYKVRRYPTVYVIGMDSEILAVEWPKEDATPAETMASVETMIRDYLAARQN